MDKQFPINLPSVQVTYRIFLRDMLPGWIMGMVVAYGLAPKAFENTPLLISIFLLALIWSPIAGLLVNTLGYILFEWILDSKFIRFLFSALFRANAEAKETFGKKIIDLACGADIPDDRKLLLLEELKRRSPFLIRAAGWSEKDEIVERVHGVLQAARSLSFMSFAFALLLGQKTFIWYSNNITLWHVLLITGFVLLLIACFLTQYATVVDIRLLYELLLQGAVSPSVIRGELPVSNKIS
jgi:hypothetical protein